LRAKKNRRLQEVWSPNLIGRKYKVLHLGADGEVGTHASPRMHRRRGHFRKQGFGHRYRDCVCGHDSKKHDKRHGMCYEVGCDCISLEYQAIARFEAYRTIWLEPCWVNASIEVI
jgi:hypothetical protein